MNETKFKNDRHFEESIVQAIIIDNNYAEQMLEVLNTDYFNIEYLKELTKLTFAHQLKYKTFPSYKTLVVMVRNEVPDGILKEQMINYLLKIKQNENLTDLDYIKEVSLDFCKKRALFRAFETSLSLTEEKKYDQIKGEIEKALSAGSEKNLGHMYEEQFEDRMQKENYVPIPTPWDEVNKKIKGGLGGGKLGCIGALAKVGKSHCLVDIGAHAVVNSYTVVHYTLELSEIDTGHRYDSRISGICVDNLYDHKDFVKGQLGEKMKAKLVIKSFPTKKATVQTLRNHYNNLLSRGIKPDLILVDYADLLRSSQEYDAKRLNEEAVYEELRGWAMEINKPIWTVTQINREGYGIEVLTAKNLSECFAKAMIVDLFMTINRDKTSPTPEVGNMFIDMSRLGPDGIKFPMMINTGTSKINILPPSDMDGDQEDGEEGHMAKLRKKFKEMQKKATSKAINNDDSIN